MNLDNTQRTDYLVVLKEDVESFIVEPSGTEFKQHTFYRAIQLENENQKEVLVFGEVFINEDFDNRFETAHERIMRDFKLAKLIDENGKPISKTKFKKLCDLHEYSSSYKSKHKLFKGRFVTFKDRGIYTFQTNFRENKKEFFDTTYKMFMDIIDNDLYPIEYKTVQYGNCGMPLTYTNLRVRDTVKSEEPLF